MDGIHGMDVRYAHAASSGPRTRRIPTWLGSGFGFGFGFGSGLGLGLGFRLRLRITAHAHLHLGHLVLGAMHAIHDVRARLGV